MKHHMVTERAIRRCGMWTFFCLLLALGPDAVRALS